MDGMRVGALRARVWVGMGVGTFRARFWVGMSVEAFLGLGFGMG